MSKLDALGVIGDSVVGEYLCVPNAGIARTASDVACEEAARRTADLMQAQANDEAGDDDDGGDPYIDVDVDDDEDEGNAPPAPPDGLYGWVICFVSFACNLVVDGISNTFGIFLLPFVIHYDSNRAAISLAGSLLVGICLSSGSVVAALVHKFGCRAVSVSGSIVACSAMVGAAYSNSIVGLVFCYGIVGGFGFAMIYLPTVIAVSHYFERHRSLATAIASCGSGLGVLIFAPFTTYMTSAHGLERTLLTFAALLLSCCVFAAFIVPLKYTKKSCQKPLLQLLFEEKQLHLVRGSLTSSCFYTVQMPDGTVRRKPKKPINRDPGVHSILSFDVLTLQSQSNSIHPVSTLPTITEAKPIELAAAINQPLTPVADIAAANQITQPLTLSLDVRRVTMRRPVRISDHEAPPQRVHSFHTQDMSAERVTTRVRKTSWTEPTHPNATVTNYSGADVNNSSNVELGATELAASKLSCAQAAPEQQQQADEEAVLRPLERKDIFYSGSVTNLPQFKLYKSLSSYRSSVQTLHKYEQQSGQMLDPLVEADELRHEYDLFPCLALSDSTIQLFRNMLDPEVLQRPDYLLVVVANMLAMAGLFVPMIYLVDMTDRNSISPMHAAYLLSIIGISKTVGQIFHGWLSDIPDVDALFLTNICMFVSGVAVSSLPFCRNSYMAYAVMTMFFGIAISGYISLTSMLLVDLVGLDKLTNAFGLLMLFRGLGVIVGIPLVSVLCDVSQNLDLIFFFACGFFMLATIIGASVQYMRYRSEQAINASQPDEEQDTVDMDGDLDANADADTEAEAADYGGAEDDDDQPITILHKNNKPYQENSDQLTV